MKHNPVQIIATALFLSSTALVHASDNAAVIFPAEGNKTCSDYSANGMILQMGTTSPLASGSLSGPENPRDADSTGETVTYTVDGGQVLGFSGSTTPIDYALLKSGRSIALIIYPSGGVTEDANMKLTVGGVDQTISAINLCYGLGNVAPLPPPPPPPSTIPSCDVLNESGGFDGIQVMCPQTGRSIVYNFELDGQQFYNTSDSPLACVCNSEPLMECDPDVPYPGVGACPQPVGEKSGAEVTTHIELNNDPYVCSTIGGKRTCYYY